MNARLDIRKTYKLYINGAFPRSESGRSYAVQSADGSMVVNAARASRKDVRDAVVAARAAHAGWARATAYNRGQVLYRVAEMLEGRRDQFVRAVVAGEQLTSSDAEKLVDAAIDRWVWYAGWSDKYTQIAGAGNPVSGPYFNLSVPEPVGVVAAVAPQRSSLLGLVSVVAPIVVSGNAVVVVASEACPLPALELAEVLATSDVPAGVVNILTGHTDELAPVLAAHLDINALDMAGLTGRETAEIEIAATENVKRVRRAAETEPDYLATPHGADRILAFCETKTVWHPKGF